MKKICAAAALCAFLCGNAALAAPAVGQPPEAASVSAPAASAPAPLPEASAQASSAAASNPAAIPAVPHEPELVTESPADYSREMIAGGIALALLAAGGFWLRARRRRRVEDVRNAQDDFWNPMKVVPFRKDSQPLPQAEASLEAVEKTVEAVMQAEREVKEKGGDAFEAAALEAAKKMGEAKAQIEAKAAAPKEKPEARPALDPAKALSEYLTAQLDAAEDFARRGAVKEARELALEVRKERAASPEQKARAAAFVERLSSKA